MQLQSPPPKGMMSTAPLMRMHCFKNKQTVSFLGTGSAPILADNTMEEDGCGVKRAFVDPTVGMFMVGHYNNKAFFLITIKSFDSKICSLYILWDHGDYGTNPYEFKS